MRVRHILGIAICCAAMGALGGQAAQAQPTDPTPFVQLLLMRETNQINKEMTVIAQQNTLSDQLNSGGYSNRLVRKIDMLQSSINSRTSLLLQLEVQLAKTLRFLKSPNIYATQAAANAAIIRALVARPPYGIAAATQSK